MIRAQAAIVGAVPANRHILMARHLRRLEKHFAAAPVIVDIVGHKDAFGAVQGTALQQVHAAILKHDFASARRKHCEQMEIAVS